MIAKRRLLKNDVSDDTSKVEREERLRKEKNYSCEVVPLNEDTFIQKAKDGDRDAFKYLVEKYQKRAFAVAYSVTQSYEDAEDIVQESFVKAFYSLKNFKGDSSFYTWFYRIVYNMSIDLKRRHKRRGVDVDFNDDVNGGKNNPTVSVLESNFVASDEALSHKEESKRINEVLKTLSPLHRATIIMRDVEGLSYSEIAKALKIRTGTVMSRLFYARKYMQKALADMVPKSWVKSEKNE